MLDEWIKKNTKEQENLEFTEALGEDIDEFKEEHEERMIENPDLERCKGDMKKLSQICDLVKRSAATQYSEGIDSISTEEEGELLGIIDGSKVLEEDSEGIIEAIENVPDHQEEDLRE